MLAPYARLETSAILALGAAGAGLTAWLAGWWALVPAAVAGALLAFYRDPPRRVPCGPDVLLAPADGRIVRVERDYRATPDAPPELRIVIFLSVLDVHVNRSPCAARVLEARHTPGKFLNALSAEATLANENCLLTLAPAPPLPGPLHVRQIAGLLAKRIVCAARPGATLAAGERYGMIKLGSQTELRAPEDERWRVGVSPGDRVRGGRTVLARLESTKA